MLPLMAGAAARLGAGTAARAAVTSAAESGAIRAGTTSGTRMLSAAQFASAGAQAAKSTTHQTAAPRESTPPAGDGLGWLRS